LKQLSNAEALLVHFGDTTSTKSMQLQSYLAEAKMDFATIKKFHETLDANAEHDPFVTKRRVAVLKTNGMITEAIKDVNAYLKIYGNDMEAYSELADLHLLQHEYKKALYCAEDLLLSNPHHYIHHQLIAEIYYSMGDLKLSKKYYQSSLELNPEKLRSKLGLSLCNGTDVYKTYQESTK
jgi:tetratricopeptide (TPR) repeat protein